jgi:O-antigen/teichoic acid export membrane protein
VTFRERRWDLPRVFYRARLGIELLHLPLLGTFMGAGSGIVKLILAPGFWEAGWIFEVLCLRTASKCVFNPLAVCCLAIDATAYIAASQVVRMVCVVIAVPLGWYLWGLSGVVWGAALSELPSLGLMYWKLWRSGIVRVPREIVPPALVAAGWLFGLAVSRFLP